MNFKIYISILKFNDSYLWNEWWKVRYYVLYTNILLLIDYVQNKLKTKIDLRMTWNSDVFIVIPYTYRPESKHAGYGKGDGGREKRTEMSVYEKRFSVTGRQILCISFTSCYLLCILRSRKSESTDNIPWYTYRAMRSRTREGYTNDARITGILERVKYFL